MAQLSSAGLRSNALSFRAGERRDVDALLSIEQAAFTTNRLTRRSFRRLFRSPTAAVIVASRGQDVVGYAVVLFRKDSLTARLYSIAVAPGKAGAGLGSALLAEAEAEAIRQDCLALRLEVRADNAAAIRLYERHGYRQFGRHESYYCDGMDALRFEKPLAQHLPRPAEAPPYVHQSTDFTCGPACAMMALGWADPSFRPEPALEFRLWREATTIFMGGGIGGCGPYGLAVALQRRGLRTEVHVSRPGPYFMEGVRSAERRRVMELTQEDFRKQADALGIPTHLNPMGESALAGVFDAGGVAIILVSGHQMVPRGSAHWVFAFGRSGRKVLLHDPAAARDEDGRAIADEAFVVPWPAFARMTRLRHGLSAAIVIQKG